jgi:hypothetical protein
MTQSRKSSSVSTKAPAFQLPIKLMNASLKGCAIIAFTDKVYNAIGATDFQRDSSDEKPPQLCEFENYPGQIYTRFTILNLTEYNVNNLEISFNISIIQLRLY